MRKKHLQISDAEWVVMDVIWELGACSAAEVIERLSETHDWNHRTIRTLLARLVEKRAITYDVDGSKYIYRPAVSRKSCVRQESRSFLDKVFGGDVASLVSHFVSDEALDPDEIEKLRQLLDQQPTRKRRKQR